MAATTRARGGASGRSPAPTRPHPRREPASVYRRRRAGCGIVVLALMLVIGTLLARACGAGTTTEETPSVAPEPTTPPLSAEGFNPAMIISDADFTDATTMDAPAIDRFLATWGKGCRTGADGTPCLAAYRLDIDDRPASASCPSPRKGGKNLTVGEVIARTARACRINPQVILVTLQKEQGLITASGASLTRARYETAMGYGCPDGGECDPQFKGFDTQVYQAAAQWRKYMLEPASFTIRAGVPTRILHAPDPACGAQTVTVRNKATAALYNYTPYTPTQQALAGSTEGCSAAGIGNLRFYQYWHAWFD